VAGIDVSKVEVIKAELKHFKSVVFIAREDIDLLGWLPTTAFKNAIEKGHILVAADSKRVYGFVEFGAVTKPKWTIHKIAVIKPARRYGIGGLLINGLIKLAGEVGAGVRLKVTEDNENAIKFYQRHGFGLIEVEQSKTRKLWVMETKPSAIN
jgi:ribosomal protein S18 acetylase RimI-like enzyme